MTKKKFDGTRLIGRIIIPLALMLTLMNCTVLGQIKEAKVQILTDDGAWCWFSDPRALYLNGKEDIIVTGWVKKDGSVEVASLNLETGEHLKNNIFPAMQFDDHNNPAFATLPGSHILTMFI